LNLGAEQPATTAAAVAPAIASARGLGGPLPVVMSPSDFGQPADQPLVEALDALGPAIDEALRQHGGVLFRGYHVPDTRSFRAFAAAFGHPLLSYDFGSTPRSQLAEGIYSSTEYPAHQQIPLHNEQSYARDWPMKIWFHCQLASPIGGETPIADSRKVYQRVDAAIRQRFTERGLRYVRNYGAGLDLPWQQVFSTEDPAVVEAYCQSHAITCEWKDDGELRTGQVVQAVARHPKSGEDVWFNQAHLFHISALEVSVREALLEVVEPGDLPRNVYYGDGGPIEDGVLDEIRGVYAELQVAFPWQAGDVLMLDNMLVAHGRSSFAGDRKVVVAMAEPHVAPGA
jgi:alpha-ketoglutarate-dependent taurine dioxygenase